MKKYDMEKIAAEIVERAARFGWGYDCFVFGDEVYSMDEARAAIVQYGADEIDTRFGGSVEAYQDYIVLECGGIMGK